MFGPNQTSLTLILYIKLKKKKRCASSTFTTTLGCKALDLDAFVLEDVLFIILFFFLSIFVCRMHSEEVMYLFVTG